MKKPKRAELMKQLLKNVGVSSKGKTPAYLTRSQILDLLAIIKNQNNHTQHGETENVRIEDSSSN